MRPIEFRGKDVVTGEWRYGHYVELGADRTGHIKIAAEPTRDMFKSYGIDKDTLGQYPGEDDAEGKKVYEGDLLKFPSDGRIYEVIFRDGRFIGVSCTGLGVFIPAAVFSSTKMVGNIHDNPELIQANGAEAAEK